MEHHIDETKITLGEIDARLSEQQKRWHVLSVAGEVIQRVSDRIEQERRPEVARWASDCFRRLTAGRFSEVFVTLPGHELTVVDADGAERPLDTLSRGALAQLDLSLRLALIRAYAKRGVRFPLILDDVLADADQQRMRSAVELLVHFSQKHNTQIVYLTCQSQLVSLFERRGVRLMTMPGSVPLSSPVLVEQESSETSIRGWIDRRSDNEVRPTEPTTVERASDARQAPPHARTKQPRVRNVRLLRPLKRRQPDGPYWLSVDSPVNLVPSDRIANGTETGRTRNHHRR